MSYGDDDDGFSDLLRSTMPAPLPTMDSSTFGLPAPPSDDANYNPFADSVSSNPFASMPSMGGFSSSTGLGASGYDALSSYDTGNTTTTNTSAIQSSRPSFEDNSYGAPLEAPILSPADERPSPYVLAIERRNEEDEVTQAAEEESSAAVFEGPRPTFESTPSTAGGGFGGEAEEEAFSSAITGGRRNSQSTIGDSGGAGGSRGFFASPYDDPLPSVPSTTSSSTALGGFQESSPPPFPAGYTLPNPPPAFYMPPSAISDEGFSSSTFNSSIAVGAAPSFVEPVPSPLPTTRPKKIGLNNDPLMGILGETPEEKLKSAFKASSSPRTFKKREVSKTKVSAAKAFTPSTPAAATTTPKRDEAKQSTSETKKEGSSPSASAMTSTPSSQIAIKEEEPAISVDQELQPQEVAPVTEGVVSEIVQPLRPEEIKEKLAVTNETSTNNLASELPSLASLTPLPPSKPATPVPTPLSETAASSKVEEDLAQGAAIPSAFHNDTPPLQRQLFTGNSIFAESPLGPQASAPSFERTFSSVTLGGPNNILGANDDGWTPSSASSDRGWGNSELEGESGIGGFGTPINQVSSYSTVDRDYVEEEEEDNKPLATLKKPAEKETPMFVIKVGDPTKVGSAANPHIVYTVTTRTSSPHYSRSEFSVLRRFSDFYALFFALQGNNPGVVVPAVPDKHPFGRFQDTFVEARRSALEKCISKMANHPVLQLDPDLRMFLEADVLSADWKNKKPDPTPADNKGYLATITSTISGPKFYETDDWFDNRKSYLDGIEQQMKGFVKSIELLSKQRLELATSTAEFADSIQTLASSDLSKQLSHLLDRLAGITRKARDIHNDNAVDDVVTIMSTADEYIRLIASVRAAMASRVKVYLSWQTLDGDAKRIRLNLEKNRKAGKVPTDRIQYEMSFVAEADRRAKEARDEFDNVSRLIKTEIGRFDKERVEDIKTALELFLGRMIHRQKDLITSWEQYHKEVLQLVQSYTVKKQATPQRVVSGGSSQLPQTPAYPAAEHQQATLLPASNEWA